MKRGEYRYLGQIKVKKPHRVMKIFKTITKVLRKEKDKS